MSKRARSATIANLSRRLVGFDLQGRIQPQRAGKGVGTVYKSQFTS